MKKIWVILIAYLNYSNLAFAQLNMTDSKISNHILLNVLDENVGEYFNFKEVYLYEDGRQILKSNCDNVIYVCYNDKFYKRNYIDAPDVRWFGCNEKRLDNQLIINQVLLNYKMAYIPSGSFKINDSLKLPDNTTIYGSGNFSEVVLISPQPANALIVGRKSSIKHLKINCLKTDMNLSAAILINPWHDVVLDNEELEIENVSIIGNYPNLQGVAIRLSIDDNINQYSIISFAKFINIDIYGFRDGIVLEVGNAKENSISYINANIFNNIIIKNCLRPVSLINHAHNRLIIEGKSTIMSNIFSNIIIQHVVEHYPAFYLEGSNLNVFKAQLLDWRGLYVDSSKRSKENTFEIVPNIPNSIKLK